MRKNMRAAGLLVIATLAASAADAQDFTSNGLVAAARIPSNARDSNGETLGGFGSGMALVPGSWHGAGGRFTATLAMLPDRGWNTEGTSDYQARLQFFDLSLAPTNGAPHHQAGLALNYRKSLMLTDPAGMPTTGLDASGVRPATDGLPDLPVAANGHASMDSEAVAIPDSANIWVSDEYGPYIYHFGNRGKMLGAIRPPDAFIPMRQGHESFSANSPPHGEKYDIGNPQTGRQDNQGFEGMSITPDRKHLLAVTQSALMQDLDPGALKATRRFVRLLDYDITGPAPELTHEYVVALPTYSDGKRGELVAVQSEMLALNDHQVLLLCRDSGGGYAGKRDASSFRKVMLVNLGGASDVAGKYDGAGDAVAPMGMLRPEIVAAKPQAFLDMNDNAQLSRFGLHNGPPNDANDLYEKWESMALAPVNNPKAPDDYFLIIGSDNDFITQDGAMAGNPYADASGANVDTLVLVYRVSLPAIHQ
jgi:hypothetical protein